MSSDPRRGTGARGERIAERHLVLRGYRILERNFRTRYGEVDLVAANERAIVFCEVKTRIDGSRFGMAPLEAIGPRKRRQLRTMARQWLQERPVGSARPRRDELRFDAIGVTLARDGTLLRLEHVPGAF